MGFFGSLFTGDFAALEGGPGVYGRKPNPIAAPTPEEILEDATLANLANVSNINKLASTQNEFNLDEALKEFEKVAPGVFPELIKNITASVRGEVSEGTRKEIARGVAERGVDRGTSGSIFDENDFLRHLGLTSTGEQQRGQNNFQALMKGALPNLFDTGQSFLKPTYDPYAEFQNAIYNEKIAAAPNPSTAGRAAAEVAAAESMAGWFSGASHSGIARGGDQWGTPTTYYGGNSGASSIPGGTYYNGADSWSGKYDETGGFGAFDF